MEPALLADAAAADGTHVPLSIMAVAASREADPLDAWARRALFASGFGGGLADDEALLERLQWTAHR